MANSRPLILTDSTCPPSHWTQLSRQLAAPVVAVDGSAVPARFEPPAQTAQPSLERWQAVFRATSSCFRQGEEDPTRVHGISAGDVVSVDWGLLLARFCERLCAVAEALKQLEPTLVMVASLEAKAIGELIASVRPDQPWRVAPPAPARQRFRLEHIAEAAKQRGLDRHLRQGSLTPLALKHAVAFRAVSGVQALGVLEQPGSYVRDTLLPVLRLAERSAVVVLDPRHAQLPERNIPLLTLAPHLAHRLPQLLTLRRHFANLHARRGNAIRQALMARLEDTLVDGTGPALEHFLLRSVRLLLHRKLPFVALEIAAARALLRHAKADALVLSNDSNQGGRMFALAGKREGVPSLVLQHGLPFGEWGYLPLHGSRFGAWGEASRRWMVERGAPPQRVSVVGAPRLDELEAQRARRTAHRRTLRPLLVHSRAQLAIWPLNPAAPGAMAAMARMLTMALASLPSLRVALRPHPGAPARDWVESLTALHERFCLAPLEPGLHPWLLASDVVLFQNSTVGLEALALDVPVVRIADESLRVPAYDNRPAIPTVGTIAALVRELHAALNPAAHEARASEQRRQEALRQLYAIDGQSAARAVDELAELARAAREDRVTAVAESR